MNGVHASRFGIAGVLLFVATTLVGGLLFPGYDHGSYLISESYATGTHYGVYLRYFGFIPSGICIAAFSFLAIRALPASQAAQLGLTGLGIGYGLGTVLVGIFPCDEGCGSGLIAPSASQLIHNLSGLLTYLVVPISLMLIGMGSRKWGNGKWISHLALFCGTVSFLFVGIFMSSLDSELVGLYQRIIEGSILGWIGACSYHLLSLNRPQPNQ